MTLVLCFLAAVLVSAAYFKNTAKNTARARHTHLGMLALMYWGASLMWCVDGFAALAEGESFIELSDKVQMADDALLGLCVIALGLAIWLCIRLIASKRSQVA